MSLVALPKFQTWVDVETTSTNDDDFDLEPEAWAAFDRLCDLYGIHQSRPRMKKSSRWT